METIEGEPVTVTVHAINGLYHWMTKAQRDGIPAADVHIFHHSFALLWNLSLKSGACSASLQVVFALHSGMNEYVSWRPTVVQLLDRSKSAPGTPSFPDPTEPNETPFVVTAWTPPEALAVRSMMLECGGEVDPRLPLEGNPWASLTPQRTIDHHGTANFNNRYIQCMLPGGTIEAYAEMDDQSEE